MTGEVVPNNLRSDLTSFVGRDHEAGEIARLLEGARLLTLLGAGGVGKTRLARHVAVAALSAFPGGLWFVDLSTASALQRASEVAIAALGSSAVPAGGGRDGHLVDRLRGAPTLLVLDNCEHLLEECRALATELLLECPELTILATSRRPLGMPGEVTFPVPAMVDDEAQRLFLDRAAHRRPHVEYDGDDRVAVVEICRRLDGIPLAIELAASRVNVLTPRQIAERLDDRLAILQRHDAAHPPRHQTLRATIDWSYDLLTEPERVLLGRLAVFEGGGTIEAIEEVCGPPDAGEPSVLDLVSSLVDASLVVADQSGAGSRFRFLDTIREYAWERLADSSPAPSPTRAAVGEAVLRKEGDFWTIGFDGTTFRLRDSKGLGYLRVLLSSPNREIHVLELVGAPAGDAGEVLDATAVARYRERLTDLRDEIEEARAFNDLERASRREEEMEALVQQLSGGLGLGGRARRAGSSAERARVSVTKAVRAALDRIGEHSPALYRHLDATVHTGLACAYRPDPRAPITWSR